MCSPIFCNGQQVMSTPDELIELANSMVAVLNPWSALGLAAPQVGYSLRLLVIRFKGDALRICDPHIVSHSQETETAYEGCLSVLAESYPIERWKSVVVRFRNVDGRENQIQAKGLLARVLQHEIDHLNGWLINSPTLARAAAQQQRQQQEAECT